VSVVKGPTSSLRLGIPRAYFYDDLDSEIQAAMEAAFAVLKTLTATQHDVAPLASNATYSSWTDPYGAIFTAEAYAYHQEFISRTPDLYQAPTLKRIRAGADVTADKYIQSKRELESVRRSRVSSTKWSRRIGCQGLPLQSIPRFARDDGALVEWLSARAWFPQTTRVLPQASFQLTYSVRCGNIAAPPMSDPDLRARIKEMMVKTLMLQITADQIADDAPLFGPDGIGLDSIDALELAVGLEKNFGVSVPNAEVAAQVLRSVNSIHDYILEKRGEAAQVPPS
jgi:acyl carrier protein